MDKLKGQNHQKFFNSFIKITIVTCIFVAALLAALYYFLVI